MNYDFSEELSSVLFSAFTLSFVAQNLAAGKAISQYSFCVNIKIHNQSLL